MEFFPGLADPIPEPEANKRPADWARQPGVIASHLTAFSGLIESLKTKPAAYKTDQGNGILIVGGGKFWPGIIVGLKLLRSLGDKTPVEIWHRGEIEPANPMDLAGLGPVRLIDSMAYAAANGGARILRGWEQKLFALSHTRLRQCLYLDADAYCVESPGPLFTQLAEKPFVFWEDMPHNENTIRYETVWPTGKNGVPSIQGGQILIDREKAWKVILLAHWLNQHSDFYYANMFGDQDTWRVVLSSLNDVGLWKNLGKAPWIATAFVVAGPDKVARIVHRCQGKLFRIADIPSGRQNYNSPKYNLPRESEVFGFLAEFLQKDQPEKPKEIFGKIYENKLWGAGSGAGSENLEAKPYIDHMNFLLELGKINSVVDLGCGDGYIGKQLKVDWYTGVDCHEPHIERLKLESCEKTWQVLDFFHDRDLIPAGEWLLVKDVLHHWPTHWVVDFITWIKRNPKWDMAFFTQDRNQVDSHKDCHLGGYRALNHAKLPLSQFGFRPVGQYLHKEILALRLR